ncbi:molybdopterin converting factor subunit 1 [Aliikangiella sp. IMCC44653]
MKIKVLLFAQFKEQLNCSELEVECEHGASIETLCKQLCQRGKEWHDLFENSNRSLKVAVNQNLVDFKYLLNNDDEVAFFPPVTGG